MKSACLFLLCAAVATASGAQAARKPVPLPVPAPTPSLAPTESDWRTPDPRDVLVIDTNKGRIVVEMNAAAAPRHVARIRELTRSGLYDGRSFFRVIDGFMDQTGDPLDNGTGDSALPSLQPEFTFRRGADTSLVVVTRSGGLEAGLLGSLPVISQTMDLGVLTADHRVSAYGTFCPGVGGMARAEAPDSANSQFFLMRAANSHLDGKYTAWGRAISGQDVILAIKTGEPVEPPQDRMLKVRVLADMPAADRPRVRVIDPRGPWFKAMAERVAKQKVIDFSVCDLDIPVQVK